jgi:micrococcal nuclease
MSNHRLFHFLFLVLSLLLGFTVSAWAEKVIYVIDGDTVILDNHERVRFIGIDAPEVASKYHRAEYYGKEAKKYLQGRIEGQEVVLKPGKEPFDKYERRLAYVYLPDGTFINEELVRLGYADVFWSIPFEYRESFVQLQKEAKEKQIGMWQVKKRPWWLRGFRRR